MTSELQNKIVYAFTVGGGVQSATNPAGPQANNISQIWWLMFWVSTVVFVVVLAFLLLAVLRRSDGKDQEGAGAPELQIPKNEEKQKKAVVIGATAITILILFIFLLDSFLVGRGLTAELSRKQGVAVEVTGHQWWWEVRYLNADAGSIFTTANEIHIPVGTPIMLTLRASDVIHSFWVPNLHGKKDLIPGKVATIWLQADKPGVYRGQCAEYCGHQHAHMAFWVVAEPMDQFVSWKNAQIQSAATPSTDSEKRGQQIFMTSACVMCHAINGTPAGSNIGPNLTHFASRKTIAAGTLPNTAEPVAHWVLDSQKIKPGNRMPPNKLSPEDLQSVVDYLQSLR